MLVHQRHVELQTVACNHAYSLRRNCSKNVRESFCSVCKWCGPAVGARPNLAGQCLWKLCVISARTASKPPYLPSFCAAPVSYYLIWANSFCLSHYCSVFVVVLLPLLSVVHLVLALILNTDARKNQYSMETKLHSQQFGYVMRIVY